MHHEVDDFVLIVPLVHLVQCHAVRLVYYGYEHVEDDEHGCEAEDEVKYRPEPPVNVSHAVV